MKNVLSLISLSLLFLMGSCKGQEEPKDGEVLIKLMHNRYESKWYNTLTFKQATTFYNGKDSIIAKQTWYEAMKLPKNLVIKIDDWDSGNGVLFRNDSVYNFRKGNVLASRKMNHPLLILGFSVYAQSPEETIAALKELKVDMSKFKLGKWEDQDVYIVGDEKATQFYIEKDRLLFVRLIQNFPNGAVTDTRFNKYVQLGDGWIAPEVLFYTNGKLTMGEVYEDIKTPEIDSKVFEVSNFKESKW